MLSRAPIDLLPYVVRHQFWLSDSEWPVLQLGPGVATVNFTKPYNWAMFRNESQFLLEKLLIAYNGNLPPTDSVTLRYQNYEAFDFTNLDITSFISSKLNTEFKFPTGVPGAFGAKPFPVGMNLQIEFELADPPGNATIMLSTGSRGQQPGGQPSPTDQKVAVWQFEVASRNAKAPALADLPSVMQWLQTQLMLRFMSGSFRSWMESFLLAMEVNANDHQRLPLRTDGNGVLRVGALNIIFARQDGPAGRVPILLFDAMAIVAAFRHSSPRTWLSRRMTYTQDYLRHGSSTTMVLDQPETSMLSETDELSEETLPLIAHRRYQISATLNFKGHAEIILLGGDETLEE